MSGANPNAANTQMPGVLEVDGLRVNGTDVEFQAASVPLSAVSGTPISILDKGATSGGTAAANTTAIASAISSAGVGGTVLFPAGTFSHTGLTANQASQHWILMAGCTLSLAGASNTDSIHVSAAGVTIDGAGTVDGNVSGQTGGSGGILIQADNFVIDGVTVQNTYGVGINAQGNRPKITRCNLLTCGSGVAGSTAAIFISPQTNSATLTAPLVMGCYVNQTGTLYGIDVHNNGGTSQVMRPRIIANEVILPVAATAGLCIEIWGKTRKGVIEGNVTTGGLMGISANQSDLCTITANTCESPWNYGIELAQTNNATVTGNVIDGNSQTTVGIICDGAAPAYNTISGNTILNTTTKAILVNGGDHTAITGNTVKTPGTQCIYIQSGSNCTVQGNVLNGNATAADAISFESSTGGLVAGNVCDNFTRSGFSFYAASAYTLDNIVVGPNEIVGGTPADYVVLGSAVLGTKTRIIRGTVAPAGVSAITVTASPFTYTNSDNVSEAVYIYGGTVSQVAKNAVNLFTATNCTVWLEPNEAVVVTYSVAPTMAKDKK